MFLDQGSNKCALHCKVDFNPWTTREAPHWYLRRVLYSNPEGQLGYQNEYLETVGPMTLSTMS